MHQSVAPVTDGGTCSTGVPDETKTKVNPSPASFADVLVMRGLDELLTMSGAVASVPAATLEMVPRHVLQRWAHENAVYVFPTDELIAWLRAEIGDASALEIGAGNGGIAAALGIRVTDSWVQVDDLDVRRTLEAVEHPIVYPGSHVENLEALEAVERYHPHTVIGAYVTHKWCTGDVEGFVYGVDEPTLLERVSRYIVIGNDVPHGRKHIMRKPHRTVRAPWLITRAIYPERNAIYIWEGSR